jgi:transposase
MTMEERAALEAGLHSANTFTLRRCQILLANADGQDAYAIARNLHCDDQTVRNAIHAFNARGVAALEPGSNVPQTVPHAIFDADRLERLRDLIHQHPRDYEQPTSQWTLERVAAVAYAEGITPRQVSGETIRYAVRQLGVNWKRAKNWIHSPDPAYVQKKSAGTA